MQRRIGLKARFIGLILVIMTVMFGSLAVILLRTNTNNLRSDLTDRSKAFAALATTPIGNTYLTYRDSGTILIAQQITNFRKLDENVQSIAIADTTGQIVYSPNKQAPPITTAQAEAFDPVYLYNDTGTISRIIYPLIEADGRHRYAVVYDISSESVDAAVSSLARSILLFTAMGLLASAVITYLLINIFFLIPIKRLRDQAIVISSGYYNEQIKETRRDEIGDLARSVRQMADSLRADIEKLKEVDQIKSEFMMIASHNLRTPLTAISGYVDMAKSQTTDDRVLKMLQAIEASSQRLTVFAEDLLTISSIETGQGVMGRKESIAIAPFVSEIGNDAASLTKDKSIRFNADVSDIDSRIMGSRVHLRGAIWNLLENAVKFTPEGGQVTLGLSQDADEIRIRITDTGTGISPEEVGKLFTKFHRGTSTEVYNYDGVGIGLYVTKLIIDEHKGHLRVDSQPGKGSTFTIVLPVAGDAEPAAGSDTAQQREPGSKPGQDAKQIQKDK